MSIVGTRPPTLDEWNKYELHHRARLAIKPGITGMWQVSGRSEIQVIFAPISNISSNAIMVGSSLPVSFIKPVYIRSSLLTASTASSIPAILIVAVREILHVIECVEIPRETM